MIGKWLANWLSGCYADGTPRPSMQEEIDSNKRYDDMMYGIRQREKSTEKNGGEDEG